MTLTSGLGGQLTVDLGALARNWGALDKVSQGALTGALLKANAYGTGIEMAAKALFAAGARFFFVATPDEGIAVRTALPDAHIFVLNGLYPGAAAEAPKGYRQWLAKRMRPLIRTHGLHTQSEEDHDRMRGIMRERMRPVLDRRKTIEPADRTALAAGGS